jgi:chemotaxis protein methyltransferase WspC
VNQIADTTPVSLDPDSASCQAIEALLAVSIGLDVRSIGSETLGRGIRRRMAARGERNLDSYRVLVESSQDELDLLVEEIAVPETWFFREKAAFDAFVRWVLRDWSPHHPGEELRVLSVPCSSGEEPLSIAMALDLAGFDPRRLVVDALDVRRGALDRAHGLVYGSNSFRGETSPWQERYFQAVPGGWFFGSPLRQRVRFERGNLLDPMFLADAAPYHVIFCRNLLIYFAEPVRRKALATLDRLLRKEGLLFVGSSEAPWASRERFRLARQPLAFALRKRDASRSSGANSLGVVPPPAVPLPAPKRAAPPPRPLRIVPAPTNAPLPAPDLLEARRMADRGELEQAVSAAERWIERNGPSAEAFFLLGVVRQARGESEPAKELFRKALYLEPDHVEALACLAVLADRDGYREAAERLRGRADRASGKAGRREGER